MDWIEKADRIDKMLAAEGVPDRVRIRFVAQLADAWAQQDKARREREAWERELQATVGMCRHIGTKATADAKGVTPQAIRKRRARFYKNATATC